MSDERRARTAWRRHLPPGLELDEVLAGLGQGSLGQAFADVAARAGDRAAVRVEGEVATHRELDQRAGRVAGWLGTAGVRPGDRILLSSQNDLSLVTAYVGVLRAGAVAVLASPSLTAYELDHLVTDAEPALAFAQGPAITALRTRPTSAGLLRRVVALGAAMHGAETTLADVLAAGAYAAPADVTSQDPALLAYTSGTTGVPKGVVLTHGNLLSSIRSAMLAWRWVADDVLVHALPLMHQHGLGGVHAALLSGSRVVVLERFDAERLLRTVEQERASVLFAVPAVYERLVALPPAQLRPLAALRLAVCGSAPMPPRLFDDVGRASGTAPLERYGTTESGLDVSNLYDQPRLPGVVGVPLPGVELRIADGDGTALPDGQDGEVLLRGPQVFTRYWGRPEATQEAFHPGGWFRTGDVGRLDPETGALAVTGRLKELIITGGLNVYPREVELALELHPDVSEAAVAGLPSESWGEQVTAWVVPVDGRSIELAELGEHLRAHLATYKCPKQVFVVGTLPRNEMGKLVRRRLAVPTT
ncbi:MAG: AMP-dependent synthetase and ligase [Solirubrobacterales bacterium]|nr:AMP-dependent synthetase and ligase [Solirubrobacterales bacterium]